MADPCPCLGCGLQPVERGAMVPFCLPCRERMEGETWSNRMNPAPLTAEPMERLAEEMRALARAHRACDACGLLRGRHHVCEMAS